MLPVSLTPISKKPPVNTDNLAQASPTDLGSSFTKIANNSKEIATKSAYGKPVKKMRGSSNEATGSCYNPDTLKSIEFKNFATTNEPPIETISLEELMEVTKKMKQDIETWRIAKSDIEKWFKNKKDDEEILLIFNGPEIKAWNERVDSCHEVLDGINNYYKPGEFLKESLQAIEEMNDYYTEYSSDSNEILQKSIQVIKEMVDYCEKDALIPGEILQNNMKDIKNSLDFFEQNPFFQQAQENETSTEQGKALQDKIFKIKDIFYFYTEDYYPDRIFRYVINEKTIGIMVMTKNLPKNSENPTEGKKPFIEIDFLVTHIGSNQCGGILMEEGVNYFCQSGDTLILTLDSLNLASTEHYKGLGFKPLEPHLEEFVPMSLNLEESEHWIYNGKWCLKNHINKSSYVYSL